MIPELGYAATVAALALALFGCIAATVGASTERHALVVSSERAAIGVWLLVTACMLLLVYAFLTFDFSVRYVASNTNRGTPFYYRITALWGSLEGSIILWTWMLSLYTLIVALYLGFTGFTVPFAFAMAALIIGRTGDEWITITRRWTIIAWYFLSLGLLIGGWWSYHVLGWGGYWAWDPVENAAFMPFLTATAFLHSVMVQERRRMLKLWNLSLIILTFGLTIFGTFLTRSGIIGSVHSFTQGSIGIFFLGFLALVFLGSFSLLASRVDRLRAEGVLDSVVSRESTFLLNNLFLVAAAFTVFFGTVFPLLSEAVRGVKVSVGAPFFNLVNIPVFLALLFLMGVGPLFLKDTASTENLRRNFLKPVLAGIAAAAILRLVGIGNALVLLCMALVVFVTGTIVLDFSRAVRARRRAGRGWLEAAGGLLVSQNRRYGGFVVHLGVLVVALGVAGSQAWSVQTETTLEKGQSVKVAGYNVRFDGLQASEESNHSKVTGTFTVSNSRSLGVFYPAKKFYPQEETPIAGVDYRLGLIEDLYLVLGDFARDGSHATIKVQVNRMVSWLWLGGLVLTLGAALAILPDRRRSG